MDVKFIRVGSTAFFLHYKDFKSKDVDYVCLMDHPTSFKDFQLLHFRGKCLFRMKRGSTLKYIDWALTHEPAMQVGKFLVPEFIEEIGLTIDQLNLLEPLIEKLDKRHLYEKIIYDAYIKNNSFTLTEELRLLAYNSYRKSRNLNISNNG